MRPSATSVCGLKLLMYAGVHARTAAELGGASDCRQLDAIFAWPRCVCVVKTVREV
jgi:hypothetical protein